MTLNTQIVENYRDDSILRNEFHNFVSKVFPSANFKEWYKKGFWTDSFRQFSIVNSGKIISNVSITFMRIILNGKKCKAIQLGTVGTLVEYRKQGFSGKLMEYVLNKFQNEIDFFFLYANESVLNFYPKFGFKRLQENVFIADVNLLPKYSLRKLNIEEDGDYLLLKDMLDHRQILTKRFGAENYGFITMWHILNIHSDNLYYLEQEDVVIIKKEENGILHIFDMIFRKPFDIQSVLPQIIESKTIKSIHYYFPSDQIYYEYDQVLSEDTGLFIRGNIDIRNKPFRFPITAIT
jgi:N-acetylglutamate synthase-like GNAT family acetyltransferase